MITKNHNTLDNAENRALPKHLAIAGGWGYIGQKFIQAAQKLDIPVTVFDPGPQPEHVTGVRVVEDAETFYGLEADFFHLALHPGHREMAFSSLCERKLQGDEFLVLCEKPMVEPSCPESGPEIMQHVRDTRLALFYDYLELFDPITQRIRDYLLQFKSVSLLQAEMHRSKDREDPDNPRNYKVMVPIQYQETVHCIAWLLYLLSHTAKGLDTVWPQGISASGRSEPYNPPNPEAYPHTVDGCVEGFMRLGGLDVRLDTNFKSGAPLTKRRVLKGIGDGTPFVIEAEYQAGHKYLKINGVDQGILPADSTYEHVIRRGWAWFQQLPDVAYAQSDAYPTALFAWYTYLLSSLLWDSCKAESQINIESKQELLYYNPQYAVLQRRHVYVDLFPGIG